MLRSAKTPSLVWRAQYQAVGPPSTRRVWLSSIPHPTSHILDTHQMGLQDNTAMEEPLRSPWGQDFGLASS